MLATEEPTSPAERPIAVHFVPYWPKNPYHAELARHLASHGVTLRPGCRLKEILHPPGGGGTAPDIVHLHALPPFKCRPMALLRLLAFWFRLRQLRRRGTRIVWTVHNVIDHESAHPRIDRLLSGRCYRFADAVIVHAFGARELIEAEWRTRRSRDVFTVHHGHFIDSYPCAPDRSAARRKLNLPGASLVFLFIGNIRPYKGVHQLVRTFKSIASPTMRLVIAGEAMSEALRREIEEEIGGSPLIVFRPGFLPDADVPVYLAAADVVVFPYAQALTSGALILAMSFGRACIAPNIGTLGEMLDDGGGFRYEPSDPHGLLRALVGAVEQRSILALMGEHNRERARGWSWTEAGRKTAAVYRLCLAPSPQS